jgi:diketogulonate reductase-like aldo/keto reductase
MSGEVCRRAVMEALQLGYRHIDTAEFYGNENAIGQAIHESGIPRNDIFLVSKVWRTHLSHDEVMRACSASLKYLQTEYLDLYLIHWPNNSVPHHETLAAMNQLVDEGKARHIGVSNYSLDLLREAQSISDAPIFCNQVRFSLFHSQREMVEYCNQEDILLTAYSPLAKSRVVSQPLVQEVALSHDRTPAQAALRWLVQQGKVAVIPKAAHRGHLQENMDIFDFELTAREMEKLSQLAA